MIRPLIPFILLAFISVPVFSQQEISLSIKNSSTLLPTGGRIQAAANIGELTLVAWGSVGLTRDSGGIVVLRARLVRGAETLPSPLLVHGDSARPSGAVAVVPLRDRFLVLWNDVRADRPGIYMRSIDTTGRPVGEEELFSTLSMDSTGMRVFGGSGMSHVLLWRMPHGPTAGTYMRELGVDGAPEGAERRIGTSITIEKSYSFLPHVSFIGVDAQPVFAVVGGRVDPRPIPRSLFEGPVFIGADTSLATMVGDTSIVYFSAFDTSQYRRAIVDTLADLIRGSTVVTVDSAGGLLLYFTTLTDEPDRGILRTYRQGIPSRNDPLGHLIEVDSVIMEKSLSWYRYSAYRYDGIVRTYGCDNACYNDVRLYLGYMNNFGYRDEYRRDYRYAIDSRGNYHRDDTLVPDQCGPRDLARVYRAASEGISSVRMTRNDTTLLFTDTIPRYWLAEPRSLAGLIERNNAIYVAWKETTGLGRSAVARWSPGMDTALSLCGIGKLPHVGRGGYANKDGFHYYDEEASVVTFSGASVAVNGSRMDYYDSGHDPNYPGDPVRNTEVLFYVATSGGWRGGTLVGTSGFPTQVRPEARYMTSGTNPDNGESVVAVSATWLPSLMLYGVDPVGRSTWSMGYEGYPDPILPAGPSGVLVCGYSDARLIVNGKVTATIRYSLVGGAHYQRLFGEYFLRAYFTGDRMLRLERYRMDGREAGSNSIELRSHVPMPFIVQSRTDSSFALLYNDGQLRAAILDDSLRLVVDTVVASPPGRVLGGPVGLVRNDSLFVAWGDDRNGIADIYGTIVRIPRRRGTSSVMASSSSPAPSDISITPLPARELITITLPSGLGDGSLEIHDVRGLSLRRKERIASGVPLPVDVTQFPNGVYLVELEAGGRSFFRKIVVLH